MHHGRPSGQVLTVGLEGGVEGDLLEHMPMGSTDGGGRAPGAGGHPEQAPPAPHVPGGKTAAPVFPAPSRSAPQPLLGQGRLPAPRGVRLPGCGLLNPSNQMKSLGHLLNSGLRGSPFFSFQRPPGRTPSPRYLQNSALNYTEMERAGRRGRSCRRRGAERALPESCGRPMWGSRCLRGVQVACTMVGSWLGGGSLGPRSSPVWPDYASPYSRQLGDAGEADRAL